MTAGHRPAGRSTDRSGPTAAEIVATGGAAAALLGAVPIVVPTLVAGCLSCVGIGTAAGLGATSALPPSWWIAGFAATGLAVAVVERHRARRSQRKPRTTASVVTLVVVAAIAWVVTRHALVPIVDWFTGSDTGHTEGPILP